MAIWSRSLATETFQNNHYALIEIYSAYP